MLKLRKNFGDLDQEQIVKWQLNTVHQQGSVSSYFCNLYMLCLLGSVK